MSYHGCGVKPCSMCDVPGPLACLLDYILIKDHCETLELELTGESHLTLD